MIRKFWTVAAVLLPLLGFAQKSEEVKAISNLCGCFEVEFKYAETFASDSTYTFKPRYQAKGLEWVTPMEKSQQKMVLQHLLIVDDSTIVKHWREDWEYQKTEWLVFDKNATWKKTQLPAASVTGQWTQTVWEVDDAPRYQGSGFWVSNDGKFYWENTSDAPLPRREYTKRSDYNVMVRENKIIVGHNQWIHEQDNKKVLRANGEVDKTLVLEKGYNIYTRVPESRCKAANQWWGAHEAFWKNVRKGWTEVLAIPTEVHILSKVDGIPLYLQLDKLESKKATTEIVPLLKRYITNQNATAIK